MIDYSGMTVNERLIEARLMDAFEEACANGDLAKINTVLRKVDLWQDENGMNWSLNAPNQ